MTATEFETLDLGRLATVAESFVTEENGITVTVSPVDAAPAPVGAGWRIETPGHLVTIAAVRDAPGQTADVVDHVSNALGHIAAPTQVSAVDPAASSVIVIADPEGPALIGYVTPRPEVDRRDDVDPLQSDGLLSLGMLREVPLEVSAELGHARLSVAEILQLNVGSVIELDRTAGAPVDVVVNGSLIALGEVVVIDDEYGVRITEIVGRVTDTL